MIEQKVWSTQNNKVDKEQVGSTQIDEKVQYEYQSMIYLYHAIYL